MKTIHFLLLTGFVLFFTKVGAQQQVSMSEAKRAAVGALISKTGLVSIDEQAIDTVFTLKNERNP